MSICKRRVLKQLGFYKTNEIEIVMPRLAVILDCKGAKRKCEIFAQSATCTDALAVFSSFAY